VEGVPLVSSAISKARLVQGHRRGRGIHLQERLPAGAHDERPGAPVGARPVPTATGRRQVPGGCGNLPPPSAVGAHGIRCRRTCRPPRRDPSRARVQRLQPAKRQRQKTAGRPGVRPPRPCSVVEDLLDGVRSSAWTAIPAGRPRGSGTPGRRESPQFATGQAIARPRSGGRPSSGGRSSSA